VQKQTLCGLLSYIRNKNINKHNEIGAEKVDVSHTFRTNSEIMKTTSLSLCLALFACTILSVSCKKVKKDEAYFKAISEYVSAHTGGAIGRTDPIRVVFARAAIAQEQIGTEVASGICKIDPSITGSWKWETDHSMAFTHQEPFKTGQKYAVKVQLSKIFKEVPDIAQALEFSFETSMPSLQIEIEGIQAKSMDDLKQQQIKGNAISSEQVESIAFEGAVKATQNGKELPILWRHEQGGLRHYFIVDNVARGNAAGEVLLNWSAKSFGGVQEGKELVTIPSLGDFSILKATVQQTETQCVVVNFSDPILPTQDLAGLLRIEAYTGKLRYIIEGNFVTIYPESALEGQKNLIAEPGIKNIANAKLVSQSSYSLDFEAFKPLVRILGKGTILPGEANGDVLLPFEAIGLKAIDVEIFKIFQSNVLQFLQTNDIEGNDQLDRVGRIVMHKKISLSELNAAANSRVWQRYALNLRDLIEQDPGAIYQVRLGFRRGYTEINCPENDPEDGLAHLQKTDEYGNLSSIMGDYRGIYQFNGSYYDEEADEADEENYNYSQRDNPCEKEYYNSDHFTSRNVFVSNIGISAKLGKDKSLFVVTTQLKTAKALTSVQLDIYDYQLQKILSATTDGTGIARIENLPSKPYIIAAKSGDDRGYVRLFDGASLSLSNFDVAGVEPQKGLKGYLYGERGVWRPGDSLYLNFVLEPQSQALPANHPLTFELTDASGKLQHRHVTTTSVGGVYALHCATNASAPTGSWQAKVMVGGATFIEPIRIETVKPNRLKIDLNFSQKAFYASDKTTNGQLTVNWLHGAPAQNVKARIEMQVKSEGTSFNQYKGYVFDDPTRKTNADPQVVFDGSTGADGKSTVPLNLQNGNAAPGKLTAAFKVRAFEQGGDFSTDQFSIDYYPYDYYIGMLLTGDGWGGKTVDREKGSDVRFVVLDRQGNPVANRTIEVGLYRLTWQWWWDSEDTYALGQYNGTTHIGAIQQASVKTNAKGQATYYVKPNDWGRYIVRAIDPIGGHSTGNFFWSGYPEDAQDMASRNAAAMLPFTADKDKYAVGETVTLRIPASEQGRILVSLEDGERVVDAIWQDAKAGENSVTFRTTSEMAPNLYAHVSLYQPHAQTKNDLPIRMYGIIPIMVEDQAKHLEPQLSMPNELKPGKPFKVEISEAKGRACTYTLAVVDDGLLDLTRFETPDAFAAFNKREALGVTSFDIYDHVLGAYATSVDRIMSIGGDAFNTKSKKAAQVNRFKPAIVHIGPFRLEKGKKAQHTLQLDNYVGSVRAMLVCSDAGLAYGSVDKTCAVKQALMIMPTLPRVLGPGETLKLPVEVFAMEGKIKSASVSVKEASGLVQILTGAKQLQFASPGQQMTSFDIKAGNKTGIAKFTINAQGSDETTAHEIEIEVRNPNPVVNNVVTGVIEPGQTWQGSLAASQYSDMENAMIEVSALQPLNLGSHLDNLIRYPHGCVEQVTSGAFPQLYVDLITTLSAKQKTKIQKHITAAVTRLAGYQTNGGFSYWPGQSTAHDYTSSYVGHFLLEAKQKGYAVPDYIITSWKNYQANAARQWTSGHSYMSYEETAFCQAYRLYTLALAGAPAKADMNRLLERNDLPPHSAALLASAYAQVSEPEVGKKIMAKFAEGGIKKYEWWGYTYGSELRDQALILEAYTLLKDPKAAKFAGLVARIGDNEWYHTSEIATSLRALSKYAASQSGSSGISCEYALNGQGMKTLKTTKYIGSEEVEGIENAQKMIIKNTSQGKLYVRISYNGRPIVNNEQAVAQTIQMTVRYTDAKGQDINIAQLKQGTDFYAEVAIKSKDGNNNKYVKDMALTHVFPSGWEILGGRLSNMQTDGGTGQVTYRDTRDDRVLTYFDLNQNAQNQSQTYRVQLNAAYPGKYYLPAIACEAMYNNRVRAVIPGRWVEVI
jgi:alpha-2-macroglobulin